MTTILTTYSGEQFKEQVNGINLRSIKNKATRLANSGSYGVITCICICDNLGNIYRKRQKRQWEKN